MSVLRGFPDQLLEFENLMREDEMVLQRPLGNGWTFTLTKDEFYVSFRVEWDGKFDARAVKAKIRVAFVGIEATDVHLKRTCADKNKKSYFWDSTQCLRLKNDDGDALHVLDNRGTFAIRVCLSFSCNRQYNRKPLSGELFQKVALKATIYQHNQFESLAAPVDFACGPGFLPQGQLIKLHAEGANTDVVFTVDGTTFLAHSFVLASRAKELFNIFEESPDGVVDIANVDEETFGLIYNHIYTVAQPPYFQEGDEDKLKALLVAANKYDLVDLKLYAEAKLASECLNSNNVIDLLVFAESQTCALLKDEAIKIFNAMKYVVVETDGWKTHMEDYTCSKSLLLILCMALPTHSTRDKLSETPADKLHFLDVASLRRFCREARFNSHQLDGTREMLVQQLVEFKSGGGSTSDGMPPSGNDVAEPPVKKVRRY